jgi:phosphomethylpyrimidine synthase
MNKQRITTNNGVNIGCKSETVLNILLGFNSPDSIKGEYDKLNLLTKNRVEVGMITDLSMYDVPLREKLWKRVVDDTEFIAGTVPIYLAKGSNNVVESKKLLEAIQQQSEEGVGIITIHPTASRELLNLCKNRLIPFTSRGGGVVVRDLLINKRIENVYLQLLDSIIKIAKKNKTIISIGSSFRSATIIDAFDEVYQQELKKQVEIAEYLSKNDVQVILETPGHADPRNIFKISEVLKNYQFPIMPLGPIPTDIAGDQDDTAAVIGAVLMGTNYCADILSVVTKEEHTGGIPSKESLLMAIDKYKIAKHIIDLYKLGNKDEDLRVSRERMKNKSCLVKDDNKCTRCGDICPLRLYIK